MPEAIVSSQTFTVDTISGATNSSNAVLTAVEDCVIQAGGDVSLLTTSTSDSEDVVVEELSCVVVGGDAGTAIANLYAAGADAAMNASVGK